MPPQPLRPRIGDVDGQSSAGQDGDAPCDDRHRTIVGGDGGGHERDQAAHQAADGAGGNPGTRGAAARRPHRSAASRA